MRIFDFPVLAIGFLGLGTVALADEPRPPLQSVAALRLGNYGSPSVLIEAREQVRQILAELNALRSKPWRQGEPKLSCYATLLLLEKGRQVGYFRIQSDYVVERPSGKGQSSYSLAVAEGDLPRLTRLMAEIQAPKCE